MTTSFLLALLTAFILVLISEMRPDAVLCEGGALATRYPLRPVLTGVCGAFLLKMLLIAFLGYGVGQRIPPRLGFLPKAFAAIVFLTFAYRLVIDYGGTRQGNSGRANAIRWGQLPSSAPFWQVTLLAFTVLFLSEWVDLPTWAVLNIAAGRLDPRFWAWSLKSLRPISIWTSLGAGLGGAGALICKEVVAILAGAQVRSWFSRAPVRYGFAACCIVAAVVCLFH